jgi:orotate phosphoribosyltransferase
MLAQLFVATKVTIESVGSAYLGSEVTTAAEPKAPDLVCVLSMPPGGLAQARYICRRLRAKLPSTPILVIRPGVQGHGKESAQKLTADGASSIAFTLEEARSTANSLLLLESSNPTGIQVL